MLLKVNIVVVHTSTTVVLITSVLGNTNKYLLLSLQTRFYLFSFRRPGDKTISFPPKVKKSYYSPLHIIAVSRQRHGRPRLRLRRIVIYYTTSSARRQHAIEA